MLVVALVLVAVSGVAWAQEEGITLESLAEAIAQITGRVDSHDDRIAAIETAIAPTPTPRTPPTATPIPTATPEPAPDTVLVVTIARGNVRAGPGTQHAIVGSVSQGDTLEGPYEETGGWYQFCCIESGEKAWISSTLVSVRDEGELTDWENARRDAIEVDPETLLRYNDDYVDKIVHFSNVYVTQGGNNFVIVYLDASYDHIGYLVYENASPRVLKEDRIDFIARVDGIYTYESTTNRMVTTVLLEVVELRLTK